jgi:hypothetical protein
VIKAIHKYPIASQPRESDYWRTRTGQERLQALEDIRTEYNSWKYPDNPGFEYVCVVRKMDERDTSSAC